jgi:hypothetical protein
MTHSQVHFKSRHFGHEIQFHECLRDGRSQAAALSARHYQHCYLATKNRHIPATVLFVIGFVLIAASFGGIGYLCDLIAEFLMFGWFLPVVVNRLRKLPYVGQYLRVSLPRFVSKMRGEEPLPRSFHSGN